MEPGFDFALLADAGFPLVRFEAGDKIFSIGDPGDCLYVIKSGRVSIVSYGSILDVIGAGGIFGEMSLIDGSPRSANAVAREASELAPVNRAAFVHLVRHRPEFALTVMQVLSTRLRRMNESR